MLTGFDYAIILAYLVGVAALGLRLAGKQLSTDDYFLGGRNLPWWVVCFSTVATETSTLTVIGLPAVAYGGSLTFMQVTLGYLLGRIVVSVLLLPRYYAGRLQTTYGFLGQRYGNRMRAAAAITFLGTRLLADGVRLFATAIPIKVIANTAGLNVGYTEIVFCLMAVTLIYTYFGGIKAVVWVDAVQLLLYLLAGTVAVGFLLQATDPGWLNAAAAAGKTTVFSATGSASTGHMLTSWLIEPYAFVTAVIGGAVFSMASHGTDQLMVQRLLGCRSLRDSQKALIGSAFLVMLQFALFLFIGLLLWNYYDAADVRSLGVSRADEVFPKFIIEGLPPGVSGLLLAGIIAAAMSTLSSSVNSLASSSMLDLYARIKPALSNQADSLRMPRLMTLFWALVLSGFASALSDASGTVVELGLSIASFTYGALLGVFLLGIFAVHSVERDALIAFAVTIAALVTAVFGLWHGDTEGWLLSWRPDGAEILRRGLKPLAWPWFPLLGASVTLMVGSISSGLRRR